MEGQFDDFKKINYYANTRETFFTPVVRERPYLQYIEGSSTEKEDHGMDIQNTELNVRLFPPMYVNTDRDNEEYLQPSTLLLKCEEGPIEAMLTLFIISHRSNQNHHQRESINYEGMAEVWNRKCLSECLKYLHERQQMFPKTYHHLKSFHTKLERRINERETMRQRTSILLDDGVISTAVASRAVKK
jgi:hypothetical protein